jgi:hypothetical protein
MHFDDHGRGVNLTGKQQTEGHAGNNDKKGSAKKHQKEKGKDN